MYAVANVLSALADIFRVGIAKETFQAAADDSGPYTSEP
jgi:hypothetical protein